MILFEAISEFLDILTGTRKSSIINLFTDAC